MDEIDALLDRVCADLPVGVHRREEIRQELRAHLEDDIAEQVSRGAAADAATADALRDFGDPVEIRAQLIETLAAEGGTMWKRVAVPAIGVVLATAAILALNAVPSLWMKKTFGSAEADMSVRLPAWLWLTGLVQWLYIPAIFGGCYVCGRRGGTARECAVVAFGPVALMAVLVGVMLAQSAGDPSLGVSVMRNAQLANFLEWAGKSAVAFALYWFGFQRVWRPHARRDRDSAAAA